MSIEQCDLLLQLSSSIEYQTLIVLKITFGLVGAISISYQWHKQGVRFLVHDNTKVIFAFYYALNFLAAMAFVHIFVFEFIQYVCFVLNFRTILLSKGIAICAVILAHYVILIISFERIYSALFPAHFEKHSNEKLSGFLSNLVMLTSSAYAMSRISNGFSLFGDHLVASLEESIPENAGSYKELVFAGVISHSISPNPTAANPSHSISYQRLENRRVILIILPIEITESIITLTATLAVGLQHKFIDISNQMARIFFLEIFTMPIVPLILVIIVQLRVVRRRRTSVLVANQDVEHFESLRRAWE